MIEKTVPLNTKYHIVKQTNKQTKLVRVVHGTLIRKQN